MTGPAQTIWDTRIQCICSVVAAKEGDETELWMCANFGQCSLDPPRIIVNPNRLYPIEGMIRRVRRFSLNVVGTDQEDAIRRFLRIRRREPGKAGLAGWHFEDDECGMPVMREAIQSLCCEVEDILDTGDHTVMIARILASRGDCGSRPALLYSAVAGAPETAVEHAVRGALKRSGVILAARKVLARLRPPAPANLPQRTYRAGGQTEAEIAEILSWGVTDRGRVLSAPAPPSIRRDAPAICVVGTHWGTAHCDALRKAAPNVRLFVCGRDEGRTARTARAVKAEAYFVGLDAAVRDARVQGVTLALPHALHREAAATALEAGKHVLVEKPIATKLADADTMIEAARASGKVLMVAENMHYRPTIRAVYERILAGDLGEPLHMIVQTGGPRAPEGWMAKREQLGGGVFMDIGIHYVRALRVLLGEPDEVAVFRSMQIQTKMEGEDGVSAIFTSRYGWQCHILTTWAGYLGRTPDIVLIGDRGTFHLWPQTGYYDYYPIAPRPATRFVSLVRPYWLQAKLNRPELQRVRVKLGRQDSGYMEEMAAFLDAVAGNGASVESAEAGRRDLEITLCAYQALESGGRVAIPKV